MRYAVQTVKDTVKDIINGIRNGLTVIWRHPVDAIVIVLFVLAVVIIVAG